MMPDKIFKSLVIGLLAVCAVAGAVIAYHMHSAPRFTHVDVKGPAPYVFFDQKTKQMCWADSESANGNKVTVTVQAQSNGYEVATATFMPVCKDLK